MSANPPLFTTNAPVPIQPLPAILRGTAELEVHLRLPEGFVNTWLHNSTETIPSIPHYQASATLIFYTAAVLQWLAEHHGYGGSMKTIAKRPKVSRPRSVKKAAV